MIDSIEALRFMSTNDVSLSSEDNLIYSLKPHQRRAFINWKRGSTNCARRAGVVTRGKHLIYIDSTNNVFGRFVVTFDRCQLEADAMSAMYLDQFAPPPNSLLVYKRNFERYAPLALLVVDSDSPLELAVSAVNMREPTNIQMVREYDQYELEFSFGYRTSAYQTHFETTGELLPNIGVYTFAPVWFNGRHDAHIFHSIGAALDDKRQPDYQVLASDDEGLYNFYIRVFEKIFATAHHLGIGRVVMSLVGANNFATAYGIDRLQADIWVPAFHHVYKKWRRIRIDFMGGGDNDATRAMEQYGAEEMGNFPNMVPENLDALLVNSWDCHSMLGNGNKNDNSLDGFVGRSSAVHFFGWGVTNPWLMNNILTVDVSR